MQTHIALLRGINVGGKNLIAMADLRSLAADLGFQEVQTLLQSGNLVFRNEGLFGEELEAHLELETAKRLGSNPDYFVRTPEEWADMIANNPMPGPAMEDPGHYVVMFMKSEPSPAQVEALKAAIGGPEILEAVGRHVYATYPAGQGNRKLTNVFIERKLGIRGTARNWNTVMKLAAAVGA